MVMQILSRVRERLTHNAILRYFVSVYMSGFYINFHVIFIQGNSLYYDMCSLRKIDTCYSTWYKPIQVEHGRWNGLLSWSYDSCLHRKTTIHK